MKKLLIFFVLVVLTACSSPSISQYPMERTINELVVVIKQLESTAETQEEIAALATLHIVQGAFKAGQAGRVAKYLEPLLQQMDKELKEEIRRYEQRNQERQLQEQNF